MFSLSIFNIFLSSFLHGSSRSASLYQDVGLHYPSTSFMKWHIICTDVQLILLSARLFCTIFTHFSQLTAVQDYPCYFIFFILFFFLWTGSSEILFTNILWTGSSETLSTFFSAVYCFPHWLLGKCTKRLFWTGQTIFLEFWQMFFLTPQKCHN